jgi:hypothetical protein
MLTLMFRNKYRSKTMLEIRHEDIMFDEDRSDMEAIKKKIASMQSENLNAFEEQLPDLDRDTIHDEVTVMMQDASKEDLIKIAKILIKAERRGL